jgi:LacI family transcriptional regulator
MSTLAAKMLINGVARHSATEPTPPRDELLPFTLIQRASTAAPPSIRD